MIIKISNLEDGIHHLSFDEKAESIELEKPFYDNCKIDVVLSKFQNQIILDADLILKARFECDRCGEDYETELHNSYRMVYLFSSEFSNDENEDVDITYLAPDTDKINIKDDVRDYAMLAIPMKKLCDEDCKGLCVNCGKNLNEGDCGCRKDDVDARWLPLLELKNKLSTN